MWLDIFQLVAFDSSTPLSVLLATTLAEYGVKQFKVLQGRVTVFWPTEQIGFLIIAYLHLELGTTAKTRFTYWIIKLTFSDHILPKAQVASNRI